MREFFLLISLVVICTACKSQRAVQNEVRDDYEDRLQKVVNSADVTDADIVFVIPTTSKEAIFYFATDYQKRTSSRFSEMQSRILNLCMSGNKDAITRYLYMSEFVDGYFADDYFDNLEKIKASHAELLCMQMNLLDQNKIKRLAEFRNLRCPK